MFDLTGKTALVTGATGGIGGSIARALHAQGATVAISGTRQEALEALAAELDDRVHMITANLSDRDSVEALVPAAEAAMGQLDILVKLVPWQVLEIIVIGLAEGILRRNGKHLPIPGGHTKNQAFKPRQQTAVTHHEIDRIAAKITVHL